MAQAYKSAVASRDAAVDDFVHTFTSILAVEGPTETARTVFKDTEVALQVMNAIAAYDHVAPNRQLRLDAPEADPAVTAALAELAREQGVTRDNIRKWMAEANEAYQALQDPVNAPPAASGSGTVREDGETREDSTD